MKEFIWEIAEDFCKATYFKNVVIYFGLSIFLNIIFVNYALAYYGYVNEQDINKIWVGSSRERNGCDLKEGDEIYPIECSGIVYLGCPEFMECRDDWRDECRNYAECPGICVIKSHEHFNTHIDYIVGSEPHSVVAVDINDDDREDIITADSSSNSISILSNQGGGIFKLLKQMSTLYNPQAIAANDFDNDGIIDIAVSNWYATGFITIFYQKTDGEFDSMIYAGNAEQCGYGGFHSIASKDFNCDGLVDLVVCDATMGSNRICVFINDGDREFHSYGFEIPNSKPAFIKSADLDSDGDIDIVTANVESDDLAVIMNSICDDGNCRCGEDPIFIEKRKYSAGDSPYGVAIADLNNDNILDLATINLNSNDISIFLGKGNGYYHEAVNYEGVIEPKALAAGDINNDGSIDIIAGSNTTNSISVYLNNGDGTFQTEDHYLAGLGIHDIAVADVNNDNIFDIITANISDDTVSVLINKEEEGFLPDYISTLPTLRDIAIADFNNDGFLDWCVISEYIDRMDCYRASSTTEFTFISSYRFIEGARPRTMSVGDFNGDMLPDIAIANYGTNNFSIFLNSGDGYFQLESYYYVGKNVWSLVVSDFNNDSRSDIAVAATLSQPLLRIYIRNSAGNGFNEPLDYALQSEAYYLLSNDINNDGHNDIVIAPIEGNNIFIYLSIGGSYFSLIENCCSVGEEKMPRSITTLDFNQDGLLDIATSNITKIDEKSYGSVSILMNKGNEYFNLLDSYSIDAKILSHIESADVNKDLLPDIIVSTNSGLILLINQGYNRFDLEEGYLYGVAFCHKFRLADFNKDGFQDIVLPNYFMKSISIIFSY